MGTVRSFCICWVMGPAAPRDAIAADGKSWSTHKPLARQAEFTPLAIFRNRLLSIFTEPAIIDIDLAVTMLPIHCTHEAQPSRKMHA